MTPLGSADQGPEQIWEGDRAFVWVEIVTLLLGFCLGFAMVPSAIERVSRGRSASLSNSSLENSVTGMLVCVFIVVFAIESVILTGIWKGKQWAYVTLTIFLLLGTCMNVGRMAGPSTAMTANLGGLTVFGLLMGLAKLIFCGIRLSGSVGPPLK